MHLKFIITYFLIFLSAQAIAAPVDDIKTTNLSDTNSTSDHWSFERMKNAKPYPIPTINQNGNEVTGDVSATHHV